MKIKKWGGDILKIRYPITSKFNASESFREHGHNGLDFLFKDGTPLRSIHGGTVQKVYDLPYNIGKGVAVKWEDGKVAIYGHMKDVVVKEGQKVDIGQLIGHSGNSGSVTGTNGGYHLHFGLKDASGNFIDPQPYAKLIQEMNHGLLKMAEKGGDSFQKLSASDLFQKAMEGFGESLLDMKVNTIHLISQLPDIHTVFLKLHVILTSIIPFL